ncbi:MAG: LpxL/LpxP family Kdo(2)-lipid IV(A) lauroyl/palmitoleoyl acyltransferase [Pseudomonadota bacterium]|nr:LpxL/LpxP family Kdo(2)-lipid IV(A) lauroyl/palmitoleoyl acyltransferase [Pseudomonadota bacterium]
MSSPTTPVFSAQLLMPQYWGIWLAIFILLPMAFLPWRIQYRLGCWLGNLIWRFGKRRRHDTLTNLALCFPEKSAEARLRMSQEVFQHAGVGVFESLSAWLRPQKFQRKVTISGLHHIVEAQQNNQSILLLGAHYTMLDLGGLICSWFFKADMVYRPQNNPVLEWLIYRLREPIYARQIDHDDIRKLVRALKDKHVVWYTPDQDFGLKQGIMADFFGVPAATLTAQRRLARMDQSRVMAIHFYRQDDRRPHYHITITPPLDHYPSDDEVADANRVNQLLEGLIRIAPTQYMWFHRRFKTRPEGMEKVY